VGLFTERMSHGLLVSRRPSRSLGMSNQARDSVISKLKSANRGCSLLVPRPVPLLGLAGESAGRWHRGWGRRDASAQRVDGTESAGSQVESSCYGGSGHSGGMKRLTSSLISRFWRMGENLEGEKQGREIRRPLRAGLPIRLDRPPPAHRGSGRPPARSRCRAFSVGPPPNRT